jgi:hypothetical protein
MFTYMIHVRAVDGHRVEHTMDDGADWRPWKCLTISEATRLRDELSAALKASGGEPPAPNSAKGPICQNARVLKCMCEIDNRECNGCGEWTEHAGLMAYVHPCERFGKR